MEVEDDSSSLVPAVHCEIIQAVESHGTVNVFVICLDRVGHDQNIIDLGFGLQLACAINHARKLALDRDIHLVVLCSAKKGSFMAGADILTELRFIGEKGGERAFEDSLKLTHILCALESLSVPTIAILNGTTLGGGLELSLACDYRVADETCTQIGFPEVKIGVLPGAGGCVRLPRLIGMRKALEIILTGSPVTARKAHAMGLVDLLMCSTNTIASQSGDQKCTYDYKWLLGVLSLVEQKAIGKRELLVGSNRTDLVAMETINVYKEAMRGGVEEGLIAEMGTSWREYEYEASVKYPASSKKLNRTWSDLLNVVLYVLSLIQVWRSVGTLFPAPYLCLLTTFKCACAQSYEEAMTLNSLGFSMLASTAESKGLMGLFLLARKLKKLAVTFDLKEKKTAPIDKNVIVLISDKGLTYSSAFIQGLLYGGFEVRVVDLSESLTKPRVEELVRRHFQYSLERGHMTEEAVQEKISLLSFNHGSDVGITSFDSEGPLCVIDCGMGDERSGEVLTELRKQLTEMVHISTVPQQAEESTAVLINLGDPLRKNTLCVEVTPVSQEVSSAHIRHVASLIVASGKMPVLAPTTPHSQASHYLTLTHWALAVSLATNCRLSEKRLDSILCGKGGYTKGPFSTIAKLDRTYLNQIVNGNQFSSVPHISMLKSYLETRKLSSVRFRSRSTPSESELIDFAILSLGFASLYLKQSTPHLPETAIDMLCVSGLVHFPPTEGGPLNYLARLGYTAVRKRWNELSALIPAGTICILQESLDSTVTDEKLFTALFMKSPDTFKMTGFQKLREESLLLTSSELSGVGKTGELRKKEVFMYPLPTVLATVLVSLLAFSALVVFLYYLL